MPHGSAKPTRTDPVSAWRRPIAAILLGILLVVAALVVRIVAPEWTDFGSGTAAKLAQPAATPSSRTDERTPGLQVPVLSGRPQPATPPVAPVDVRIRTINVHAKVIPTGVDAGTGMIEVPADVATLGWYQHSAGLNASAGSIVIVGHVDGYKQGQGALFSLRNIPANAEIVVTGADGRSRTYRVVARERFVKRSLPSDRLFGQQGTLRLTLITCGGPFDQRTRSYHDNIVVTAVPI